MENSIKNTKQSVCLESSHINKFLTLICLDKDCQSLS